MSGRSNGLQSIAVQVANLKEQVEALTRLVDKLAGQQLENSKPNWPAIGIALTVLAMICAVLYWPIREQFTDLKNALLKSDIIAHSNNANILKLEEQSRNIDRRLDAMSTRLAEYIRSKK